VEENNPVVPTTPVTPAVEVSPPPDAPKSDNKIMLWFIAGLVVVALLVGGVYFYLSSQQKAAPVSVAPPKTTTQAPENLENSLNSVSVTDAEADFTPVDQDLQSL